MCSIKSSSDYTSSSFLYYFKASLNCLQNAPSDILDSMNILNFLFLFFLSVSKQSISQGGTFLYASCAFFVDAYLDASVSSSTQTGASLLLETGGLATTLLRPIGVLWSFLFSFYVSTCVLATCFGTSFSTAFLYRFFYDCYSCY